MVCYHDFSLYVKVFGLFAIAIVAALVALNVQKCAKAATASLDLKLCRVVLGLEECSLK